MEAIYNFKNSITMKEHRTELISHWIVSSLLLMLIFLLQARQYNLSAQATAKPRSPTGLYLRAPDTIPGTLPEMRDPSYWISRIKDPDAVVMTFEQIEARNRDYQQRMLNLTRLDSNLQKQITQELASRPGLLPTIPDLSTKSPAEISALVSDMINREIGFLTRRRMGNILGIQYSDQEINSIVDELGLERVPGQIRVQTGITVADCRLRIVPSLRYEYVGYTGLAAWDMWNFDIIPIGSMVQILHISKTGRFLFVLSERGLGWINSEEAALCSKVEYDRFHSSGSFVICTGDMVPYYSEATCTYVSGWFRMGDRLPFGEGNPRLIKVPTRQVDGKLLVQDAWLKSDADVSIGYLPYTRENIVQQTFKLQDNIYDWTGGWYGRDHATQLRDIFSVFGFKLPAMGGLQSAYNAKSVFIHPADGMEKQYNAILTKEPFLTILICSSGHGNLYLGDYNGLPIVFDTHGYRYNDKDGNELIIRRANVGTILFPDYFVKQSFTFVDMN
jgi:hypothetical protein